MKFGKLEDGCLCIYAGKICRKRIVENRRISYAEPMDFYIENHVFDVEASADTVRVSAEDFIRKAVMPYVIKKLRRKT